MSSELHSDLRSDVPPRVAGPAKTTVAKPVAAGVTTRRLRLAVLVLLGLGLVVAAAAYQFLGPAAKILPTLTHTIGRRDLKISVTEQGTLESSNNTEVRCRVKGASNTIVWIIENGAQVQPGDVLVRIDTSTIETNITTQEIAYQNALAAYAQSQSDVAVAEINITEYVEGTYRSELKTKEKDVAIAEANLRSAENMLLHSKEMYRKGFLSKLELEGNGYSLQQAQLELEVKQTDVDVLTRYTKAKQIQDLEGILAAKKAKLASDKASLDLEKSKLDREREQLENCVLKATTSGMVIYGGGKEWEDRPDIREGATVREDQVLLLIPDLDHMQVKIGVHEALVEQVKPGLPATVELQESKYNGKVLSIAPMAERAGWWNGNMVKYQTIIQLDANVPLKPGMSSTVEIFLAQHKNALTIPVAAVVEQQEQYLCWVVAGGQMQRRELELGDSDDQFLIVNSGLQEGDEVVLNPLAHVDEAQKEALRPFRGVRGADREEQADEEGQEAADSGKAAAGKPAAKDSGDKAEDKKQLAETKESDSKAEQGGELAK